jgi:hypothetical protein
MAEKKSTTIDPIKALWESRANEAKQAYDDLQKQEQMNRESKNRIAEGRRAGYAWNKGPLHK